MAPHTTTTRARRLHPLGLAGALRFVESRNRPPNSRNRLGNSSEAFFHALSTAFGQREIGKFPAAPRGVRTTMCLDSCRSSGDIGSVLAPERVHRFTPKSRRQNRRRRAPDHVRWAGRSCASCRMRSLGEVAPGWPSNVVGKVSCEVRLWQRHVHGRSLEVGGILWERY